MSLKVYMSVLLFVLSGGMLVAQEKIELNTIVIDPGHGGKDPGASSDDVNEKDVVLNIAKLLKAKLEARKPEINVILTREDDVFVPLKKRAEIANQADADLFVSLHINANKSTTPSGVETYVLGLHKSEENLAVAQKENAVILLEDNYNTVYEGFDPSSPESYIMFELLQDEYLQRSLKFASCVQKRLPEAVEMKDRGVKQSGFLVLKNASMPSVLIETGFVSNKENRKKMTSTLGQHEICEAIYESLFDYANSVDYVPLAKREPEKKVNKSASQQKPNNTAPVAKPRVVKNQYQRAIDNKLSKENSSETSETSSNQNSETSGNKNATTSQYQNAIENKESKDNTGENEKETSMLDNKINAAQDTVSKKKA